jgi:hypothetical protein
MTEAEAMRLGVEWAEEYQRDPVHTTHHLITRYGRANTASITLWIEAARPRLFGAPDPVVAA